MVSRERVRISWNSDEASRQCCLCSLSSALSVTSIQKVLGLNPSWILDFFPLWIYFSLFQEKTVKLPAFHFSIIPLKSIVILLYTLYHSILENGSLSYPYNM